VNCEITNIVIATMKTAYSKSSKYKPRSSHTHTHTFSPYLDVINVLIFGSQYKSQTNKWLI